ncbi:MAG: hypothetical protein WKF30_01400 [Pyrinomonadaceae bacterium]
MSARLTVIFFILLCLEAGVVLTLLPWVHPFGLSDWGDNFFLLYAAHKTGVQGLQQAISSGWVRGAVTGLGLVNIAIAVWEAVHFRQTVRALQGIKEGAPPEQHAKNVARVPSAPHVLDHERRDDDSHHTGE